MTQNKDKQIWSQLTTDELLHLDALAEQAGMTRSGMIRYCIQQFGNRLPGITVRLKQAGTEDIWSRLPIDEFEQFERMRNRTKLSLKGAIRLCIVLAFQKV